MWLKQFQIFLWNNWSLGYDSEKKTTTLCFVCKFWSNLWDTGITLMWTPRFMESPIKVTFRGVKKTVLPKERYRHIDPIFLPIQSHCEAFTEGSVLQHLEPDSVGANFNTTVLLPSVKCWIVARHKTNYSLWLTLGKQSALSATKNLYEGLKYFEDGRSKTKNEASNRAKILLIKYIVQIKPYFDVFALINQKYWSGIPED